MAILSCLQCGDSFNCKPSRIKAGKGKFCSRECRTLHSGGLTLQHPKEYGVFMAAKARCKGTHKEKKTRYCDRGIEFKFASFADFIAEMGPRPDGMQLDRIDNNGHYEKGNVRWATLHEQSNNREITVTLTHKGKTLCLSDWAEETGLKAATIWARINKYSWPVADALETPTYGKHG